MVVNHLIEPEGIPNPRASLWLTITIPSSITYAISQEVHWKYHTLGVIESYY